MRFLRAIFAIVAVLALVIFLLIAAQARKGESCSCFFVGDCQYTEQGLCYRYHQCWGSCAAYSSWMHQSSRDNVSAYLSNSS